MVGDECAKYRSMLEIGYPIDAGKVRYWEGKYAITHVWDYTFNEKMKVDPADHKVLISVTLVAERLKHIPSFHRPFFTSPWRLLIKTLDRNRSFLNMVRPCASLLRWFHLSS